MNRWFTADTHLGHANIILHCNRPWYSEKEVNPLTGKWINRKIAELRCKEMNKVIIRNWNSRVKEEDEVYVVGDFCFKNTPGGKVGEGDIIPAKYYEKLLNGKITFIKGNHDKNNSCKTIIERLVIGYGGERINLVHDPEKADVNYEINFTGHIHAKWEVKRVRRDWRFTDCINVGVDVWNFRPVSYNEIMSRYHKWLREERIRMNKKLEGE